MSSSAAGQWVKFFNASGIPSPAAATYAHIFVENRIQIDMLMDLNKEYLREMGITPMGDIIAILRHAKHVNDQTARERVLSTETHVPIAAIAANPVLPSEKTKIRLKSTATSSASSAAVVSPFAPVKPRRVLPEHEGKYKIKLPSGTTERSKQILAKQAKLYGDNQRRPSASDQQRSKPTFANKRIVRLASSISDSSMDVDCNTNSSSSDVEIIKIYRDKSLTKYPAVKESQRVIDVGREENTKSCVNPSTVTIRRQNNVSNSNCLAKSMDVEIVLNGSPRTIDVDKEYNDKPSTFKIRRQTIVSRRKESSDSSNDSAQPIDVDKEYIDNPSTIKVIRQNIVSTKNSVSKSIDVESMSSDSSKDSPRSIDVDKCPTVKIIRQNITSPINSASKSIDTDVLSLDSCSSSDSVICQGIVYSDREAAKEKRSDIFKRLAVSHSDNIDVDEDGELLPSSGTKPVSVKITGVGSKAQTSASIFSRLGGKADGDIHAAKEIKPILKNNMKNRLSTIVKAKSSVVSATAKPIRQKVLLVKKVPLRGDSDDEDVAERDDYSDKEMYDEMDISGGSEKYVKFASTAEVREIAPRRYSSPTKKVFNARQDAKSDDRVHFAASNNKLHVKRPGNFKTSPSSSKPKPISKMKADLSRREIPVHKRLGPNSNNSYSGSKHTSLSSISKRMSHVNIERKSMVEASSARPSKGAKSVFDRLGYSG